MRKPFQGVWNIVRFNWHFYLAAGLAIGIAAGISPLLPEPASVGLKILSALVVALVFVSLAVSFYVYDLSSLYSLAWLDPHRPGADLVVANIHAGFDATSGLLREKLPGADVIPLDFYDPSKHTEVSIRRARKAYPTCPGTRNCQTDRLPLTDESVDLVVLFMAAHEIRNETERLKFFVELKRVLKGSGEIMLTEHLRDLPNFAAYNVGFLHFMPRTSWYRAFAAAGLTVTREIKCSPFVTTFFLRKNGTAS